MRVLSVATLPVDRRLFPPAEKSLQTSSVFGKQLQHTFLSTWPCNHAIKTSPKLTEDEPQA